MEFDIKPKIEKNGLVGVNSVKGHSINLYKTPPFGQITLEECQDLFRQRLEALHVMKMERPDLAMQTNSLREIKSFVFKTNCICLRLNDEKQAKWDHFSHMLARMFFIYRSDLWFEFKVLERKLFYYRLRDQASSLSSSQLERILQSFDFDFERVVGSELSNLERENLIGWNKQSIDREVPDIFKVKFVDALKFISKRSVSLKDGYAFLTRHEILSVVCDVFEKHLDNEMVFGRQHMNTELPQTHALLEALSQVYTEHEEKVKEEKKSARSDDDANQRNPYRIDVANIDELSKKHFPPCMRYMHEALKEDHHLRHQGRLYYGAFLKSGGVDMDSAIEFWRDEFTKKITNDQFERNYKYNIRHIYGKEGHKKQLSCFSCDKIINDNPPGTQDKHGCPFKHFDDKNLKTMLFKHGLAKEADIESLLQLRKDNEHKLACSHYYKFTKGELPPEPIKNPAHFYYESMRLANRPPPTEDDSEMVVDTDVKIETEEPKVAGDPAEEMDDW